ncbi:AAA family ATPase [Catenulispora yoronensis]
MTGTEIGTETDTGTDIGTGPDTGPETGPDIGPESGPDTSPGTSPAAGRMIGALIGSGVSSAMAPTAPPAPPAWLPRDLPDFTGRAEDVAAVSEALTRPAGAAPPIVLLAGMAGIGKSALAVHVAHRVAAHYPDGRLYVNLRGAGDDPLDPAPVLAAFLAALGVDPARIPRRPRSEPHSSGRRSLIPES